MDPREGLHHCSLLEKIIQIEKVTAKESIVDTASNNAADNQNVH
jgi:hypothetical protein